MIWFLFAAAADAQPEDADQQEVACYQKSGGQQDLNICAGEAYERADQALNLYWKNVRAEYGSEPEWPTLLKAQRAWVTYRDKWCESIAYENRGGTIWALSHGACLAKLTRERARELKEFISPANE